MAYSAKTGYRFIYPIEPGPNLYFDASDYDFAAESIRELANYLSVVEPPMRAAKSIARNDMRERFQTETDPQGRPWVPLTENYAKWKAKKVGNRPILTLYGPLSKSAYAEASWTITGDSLFFDTGNLPPYWDVHQFGSEDFGQFFHESANPLGEDFWGDEGESLTNVPPRPFIGLSQDASSQIFWTFDEWFSEGVEEVNKKMVVSGSGVLQHRVAKGQFGPKVT